MFNPFCVSNSLFNRFGMIKFGVMRGLDRKELKIGTIYSDKEKQVIESIALGRDK